MYVLIVRFPFSDDIDRIIGPFDTAEEADNYASNHKIEDVEPFLLQPPRVGR